MEKPDNELKDFIHSALSKGILKNDIRDALLKAGWAADRIEKSLDDFADIDFPLPVPRPHPSLSAREAFFYLLLFVTLYTSAFHLGSLLFLFIEKAIPDPAIPGATADWRDDRIRFSVSSLIVAFPIYLFLSAKISREMLSTPSGRASDIRKWLTYITLFIAASVLIGDLTTLLFSLLGGELTLRFILKVLTVGAIAGTVFLYYLGGLRSEEKIQ
ncbi:MAG: hypothetical protein HGA70_09315 [Chlorobiaceae bacterium]|nr:hypothetical protein [Chlorobiaceae bacterium]NTW10013.1 hypothetical protein [Chlorobiaceae bacterium]